MKYYGIGRRKSAVAKVSINSEDTNDMVIINKKTISDYFQNDKASIDSILQFSQTLGIPLNLIITVSGGGTTGQKEAIRLALAKALCKMGFSDIFKKLLTQDSRVKERKKYGLKKARKAPQYSKR
uniref:Small ribosomal subunit protein uS9c n=1 Tax=Flabellia petiolata TaxID=189428 RepID=A0A386AX30_9CHLO|nr:ribosomal protein S9 [Flabellia petiolata]